MGENDERLESMVRIQTEKALPYITRAFDTLNELLMKETACTFLMFWGALSVKHNWMYQRLRDAMVEAGSATPCEFDLLKGFFFEVAKGIIDNKEDKGTWKKGNDPPIELNEILKRIDDMPKI